MRQPKFCSNTSEQDALSIFYQSTGLAVLVPLFLLPRSLIRISFLLRASVTMSFGSSLKMISPESVSVKDGLDLTAKARSSVSS